MVLFSSVARSYTNYVVCIPIGLGIIDKHRHIFGLVVPSIKLVILCHPNFKFLLIIPSNSKPDFIIGNFFVQCREYIL